MSWIEVYIKLNKLTIFLILHVRLLKFREKKTNFPPGIKTVHIPDIDFSAVNLYNCNYTSVGPKQQNLHHSFKQPKFKPIFKFCLSTSLQAQLSNCLEKRAKIYQIGLLVQCNLDLVTLLVSAKIVTKSNDFML